MKSFSGMGRTILWVRGGWDEGKALLPHVKMNRVGIREAVTHQPEAREQSTMDLDVFYQALLWLNYCLGLNYFSWVNSVIW